MQKSAPAGIRTHDLWVWLGNECSDVTRTRSAFSTGSYWSILLIFNTKQCKSYVLLVLKFEENRTKIATVRVPQRVSAKWPLWRHQIRNFKNREKWHSQIYSRSFVESFIKIGSSVWAVEMTHTYRHTYRQTDTHTHTLGSIATYSVKMTEYNNNIQVFIDSLWTDTQTDTHTDRPSRWVDLTL